MIALNLDNFFFDESEIDELLKDLDDDILLFDLPEGSRFDGVFSDPEKKWHDMLAAQLDVHLRVSQISSEDIDKENKKIERHPVGYRMSYRNK